jgi:peptidoglycan hydrolase-like protein with peptidoglycan-binding domain
VQKTIPLLMALSAMASTSNAAVKHKASHRAHASTQSKTAKSRRVKRSYQQTPTPDRYKEIQQALSSKGYFQGEPNGEWGADSQESLKRFQAAQNLTPDGKLNSLSLIALGLGPKRFSAQHTPAPATDVPK